MAVGMLMLPAALTSAFYGEWHDAGWILASAAILFDTMALVADTFLLAFAEAASGVGTDLVTSASAVASALGNIGPPLGDLDPTSTFAAMTAPAKWLRAFLMVLGRSEIFRVLLLFTRQLCRR